jgi:hypothetical protein
MKKEITIRTSNILFVGISIIGLASVSILSLFDPQATMDLVRVKLDNTDAISSIRGIYGGVGMSIISGLTYLLITKIILAIRFLTLFWFSYAFSRLITILVDGPLGDFGNQWLTIETAFFVLGAVLLFANQMNKD